MTPKIQGDTLTYWQDDEEQRLTVGTAAWYSWLETASTFSFANEVGTFTARCEQAGHKRGGRYWKAYRKQQGKLSSLYLGKSDTLTLERLNTAAQELADASGRAEAAGQSSSDLTTNHTDGAEKQPQNLPAHLTSLIGREQDAAAVCALLQREEVRLVTLTGIGGIGKTRLGIEVANRLHATFADGVAFVPLAPIVHPGLVLPTIKHVLGLVQPARGQSSDHRDDLKAFLQDRHMLLVLDNFEHVLSAAPNLTYLLLACPHLKLLVTSRAVLRVQGEHEFAVPPLALPKRTHLQTTEVLTQYAAVALFLERALAIKPDLPLTRANMQAIAAICVHLEGLPLAMELAAARVKLLPPRALLQRLTQTQRMEVLTGGTRDVPERQQTLRNALAWSYNLLDAAEQQIFRLLSVFVGGSTLEAIEAVSAAMTGKVVPLLDTLASLIDKSLLQQTEQEGEVARFVMLETIREYGLDCLIANGEMEIAQQAHAAYYVALAEEAEPEYGGSQQTVWLERLEREHDNLRAVMLWSLEQVGAEKTEAAKLRREMGLRLGGALRRFWLVHAHMNEGRGFLERALAISKEVEIAVRAKALIAGANLAIAQNDYEQTETLCRMGLALYRELGDQAGIAFSLHLLGSTVWNRGNESEGRSIIEEALALFRKLDDKSQIAWTLYLLGLFDSGQGKYARASSLFEESLALHRMMRHKRGIAFSLLHLAELLFVTQGDRARVNALIEEGLALSKELSDKDRIAFADALLGRIALSQGDLASACSLLQESILLYKELGIRYGLTNALSQLARVAIAQGNPIKAESLYEESLLIARELDHKGFIANSLEGLAALAVSRGNCAWAACLWGTAETLREAVHIPIPLIDRASYERLVADTRIRLGESTFAALWARGRTMTLEEVLALREQEIVLPPSQATTAPSLTNPAGLTTREVQVLRLLAQGLTNGEIAEALGLSEKTIAHHLTHIFNKTSSENRVAAVAFAFRHGLA